MSRGDPDNDERMQQLAADIAARLRGVCSSLTDKQFSELVMDIARMKLRFEVLEDLPGGMSPLRPNDAPEAPSRDRVDSTDAPGSEFGQ